MRLGKSVGSKFTKASAPLYTSTTSYLEELHPDLYQYVKWQLSAPVRPRGWMSDNRAMDAATMTSVFESEYSDVREYESVNWTLATAGLSELKPWQTAGLAMLAAGVSLVTICDNLIVLLSFMLERSIRQPSNYFIASLAVSDLLIGTCVGLLVILCTHYTPGCKHHSAHRSCADLVLRQPQFWPVACLPIWTPQVFVNAKCSFNAPLMSNLLSNLFGIIF